MKVKAHWKLWLAAALTLTVVGETVAAIPQARSAVRKVAYSQPTVRRYWRAGSRYAHRWGWRRSAQRRRVVRRTVPSVGRAASILEPPPVLQMGVPASLSVATGGVPLVRVASSNPAALAIAAFPITGKPVKMLVIDGADRRKRIAVITNDLRFITVQLNDATQIKADGQTLTPAELTDGMEGEFKGSWDMVSGDRFNAAIVTVKRRVDDFTIRTKIAEACRKMVPARPEPAAVIVPQTESSPAASPTPGETPAPGTTPAPAGPTALPVPGAPAAAPGHPQFPALPALPPAGLDVPHL